MDLPKLSVGKRYTLPRPPGSADALLLARVAERAKAAGRLTAIVTADATDAQRLIEEIAFFAPALRCALFPDWETLPYDREPASSAGGVRPQGAAARARRQHARQRHLRCGPVVAAHGP
jgi:transcription-repair coupling factor (superfamily II helicase)